LRCYGQNPATHYEPPATPSARLDPPPPLTLPAWSRWRAWVGEAMRRDGSWFPTADGTGRVAGRCPVCGDCMLVRFIGETTEAEFLCDRGCEESLIVAKLGRVNDGHSGAR
jgi:hypothetical protein